MQKTIKQRGREILTSKEFFAGCATGVLGGVTGGLGWAASALAFGSMAWAQIVQQTNHVVLPVGKPTLWQRLKNYPRTPGFYFSVNALGTLFLAGVEITKLQNGLTANTTMQSVGMLWFTSIATVGNLLMGHKVNLAAIKAHPIASKIWRENQKQKSNKSKTSQATKAIFTDAVTYYSTASMSMALVAGGVMGLAILPLTGYIAVRSLRNSVRAHLVDVGLATPKPPSTHTNKVIKSVQNFFNRPGVYFSAGAIIGGMVNMGYIATTLFKNIFVEPDPHISQTVSKILLWGISPFAGLMIGRNLNQYHQQFESHTKTPAKPKIMPCPDLRAQTTRLTSDPVQTAKTLAQLNARSLGR